MAHCLFESDGYVLPYGDDPLDDEGVIENVYLNLIARTSKNHDHDALLHH